jgi:hypothetical protein
MAESASNNRFSFYYLDGKPNDEMGVEMAPLTQQQPEDDIGPNKPPSASTRSNIKVRKDSNLNVMLGNSPAPDCNTFCAFVFAYVTYTCQYNPTLCWTLAIFALLIPSYLLIVGVFLNPTEHFGVIEHDFTNVTSKYDLAIKDIDHWCIKGDNDSCHCEDPLQPEPRSELRAWSKSHYGNIQQIIGLMEADLSKPDIAFLGGSIVEKMDGKWFGNKEDDRLKKLAKTFNKHFTNLDGDALGDHSLTAIALGIAGDTVRNYSKYGVNVLFYLVFCFSPRLSAPFCHCFSQNPSVLYRLLNGEMPDDFNPEIWWLELGLSDLGRTQCSEEVVVLGVLRVVEEIMNKKPEAKIVINSLFPMTELRQQVDPQDKDMGLAQSFGGKPTKHGNKAGGNNNPGSDKASDKASETKANENKSTGKNSGGKNPDGNNAVGNKLGTGRTRDVRHLEQELPKAADGEATQNHLSSNDRRVLPEKATTKMNGNEKTQKKFNPVTHREKKLPLWTSILAINRELAKFAGKHDNVYFFDVTPLFTEKDGNFYILKKNLINGIGIPSDDGYEVWEEAVVKRAREILTGEE